MTTIFGEPWGAPLCEGAHRAATPVGRPCLGCQVPIEAGDQGTLIPMAHTDRTATMEPSHKECDLRAAMGPLPHLRGMFLTPQQRAALPREELCRCWGGTADHPSPNTPQARYAEAREVWRAFYGRRWVPQPW